MRNLLARLRARLAYGGQCSVCQQWFDDWNGGVCQACQAAGN